jgi:hypothetical protein
MEKTMQKEGITILENVVLISAPLNLFSPERDTGERRTDDLITDKRTIQFVDTKLLAGFRRKRTELRRMLLHYGTRVPLFNAYAAPVAAINSVTLGLNSFTEDWNRLLDKFATEYPPALVDLKQKHPARAAEIDRFAPTTSDLLERMEFRYTVYQLDSGSIQSENGLSNELLSLPERVMDDIAKELNERAGQGQMFRQAIREVLGRVKAKAAGFAFLHPVIAAIPEAIDKTLAALPTEGVIQGADGIMLGGLIGALQNRRILTVGIVSAPSVQEPLETVAPAEVKQVTTQQEPANDPVPVIQAPPAQRTGTWDF